MLLAQVSGDIVQAVQALKESRPETTSALFDELQCLLASFEAASGYCSGASPQPLGYPFTRAERQVRDVIGSLYPGAVVPPRSSQAARTVSISAEKRRVGIETFRLGPHLMPRVFNGLWQLSSPAWGSAGAESQEAALAELVELGLSTAGECILQQCTSFPVVWARRPRCDTRWELGPSCEHLTAASDRSSSAGKRWEPFTNSTIPRHGGSLRRRRAGLRGLPEQAAG